MIMTNLQLKKYYFPNKQIENLVSKNISKLIKFYGEKTLFENINLLPYERLEHEKELTDKTIKLLEDNKNLYYNFAFTYSISDKNVLADIILQSIMAFSKLNNSKYIDMDIFLNPNSMLFFENIYPATIQRWQENTNSNILSYTYMMKNKIKLIDKIIFNKFDLN